ncbi:ribonuclease HII [Arthrobacter sp. H41]|uniref:ribonuclease HII n=1 Tax=Arthrobacter sp. H41 TaxID=1312978 RepID=UPI0004B72F47|nr:ribonuclease HII [Arthrobacter sp. H41]
MTAARRKRSAAPTLIFEKSFSSGGHRYIAGCDEVGRGALAGPVSVGIVVVDLEACKGLRGVRDSKLLSPAEREALVPRIRKWCLACGVGHASSAEIDDVGLMAALQAAGSRAWEQVAATVRPDVVILDGNHDWLSRRGQDVLFEEPGVVPSDVVLSGCDAPVHTRIKADLQCLSVAAASVLAKVERDALMVSLAVEHPAYRWDVNKGYATALHRAAIDARGASDYHRRSWRLGTPAEAGTTAPGIGAEWDHERRRS